MNRNDDLLNQALKTEQAGCRKDDTQCCGKCEKSMSREQFEKEMSIQYSWFGEALHKADFHGDDATGYYTGGDYIYHGNSCSEPLFWAWRGYQAAIASMQSERDQLAAQLKHSQIDAECYKRGMEEGNKLLADVVAENAALNDRMQKLIQIINNADNNYCMCGEAMETHTHGGCGHPTGMFDYHYERWLESGKETPATDRFLAEQRAMGVEMLAALAGKECQRHKSVNDRAGVRKWKSIVILCCEFAAQLRNEVKV